MQKIIAILALTVSCSALTPISVVTEAPDNCLPKGLVITEVFDGTHASEYVSDLKKDVRKLGANTLHCCWFKDFNDPSIEEQTVAYSPKNGRRDLVFGAVGEAYYCKK